MNRRMLILIVGGTAAFTVAVAVAVFWLLGKAEESTRHASTQFAAALEKNDPSAAPAGGADYVEGVRAYFGPVTERARSSMRTTRASTPATRPTPAPTSSPTSCSAPSAAPR